MKEEKILEIIEHYGVSHQQRKLAEEMFELQEAILEFEHDEYTYYPEVETSLKKHIAEEIADVCVLLLQFKEYYHIDGNDVLRTINEKIDRTLERMEK